ncbi:hypothetical protein Poli38472_012091 [Pythium oligandrum]|uniref:Peptidase M12A domain-containing protein n=1 Tax=Pythium oligandrum TaxID=41045 RepID=A0A8K1FKC9_PYTOL|nr:hypothetical protein Poli38472_012091 [Pythium oligandrum]|eukprot:TMW66975.1 hypothetical protein Poli38472_012091 [Pythium oligandrum]
MLPHRVVLLVLASLALIGTSANTPAKANTAVTSTARGKAPPRAKPLAVTSSKPSAAKLCTVAGQKFTAMSYVKGFPAQPGSVFAVCTKGVPKCYLDDGLVDVIQRKEVPCASVTANATATATAAGPVTRPKSRNLGLYRENQFMWPQGKVCYGFQEGFTLSPNQQAIFQNVIRTYRTIPGVPEGHLDIITLDECHRRYKPTNRAHTEICGDCQQLVRIKGNEDGCFGHLGYAVPGNARVMNLGADCHDEGTYLHEFGHSFGLYHEHQHPERRVVILREGLGMALDQYAVTRLTEQEQIQIRRNFAIPTYAEQTEYDPKSIMHYQSGSDLCSPAFQHPHNNPRLRWCDVFETKEEHGCEVPRESDCSGTQPTLGGEVLSDGDKAALLLMYPVEQEGNESGWV